MPRNSQDSLSQPRRLQCCRPRVTDRDSGWSQALSVGQGRLSQKPRSKCEQGPDWERWDRVGHP